MRTRKNSVFGHFSSSVVGDKWVKDHYCNSICNLVYFDKHPEKYFINDVNREFRHFLEPLLSRKALRSCHCYFRCCDVFLI